MLMLFRIYHGRVPEPPSRPHQGNGPDDTINVAAGTYPITTRLVFSYWSGDLFTNGSGGRGRRYRPGWREPVSQYCISGVLATVCVKNMTFQNGNSARFWSGPLLLCFEWFGWSHCKFANNSGGGACVSASGDITLRQEHLYQSLYKHTRFAVPVFMPLLTLGRSTLTGNEFTGNAIDSFGLQRWRRLHNGQLGRD